MNNPNRLLIIASIQSFIYTSMPSVLSEARKYNLREEDIDFFFDWVINQILVDIFGLRVIHHYRHDVFICMYNELQYDLLPIFKRSVNIHDLRTLKGCEVKTLVNGFDLFITRRIKQYANYI